MLGTIYLLFCFGVGWAICTYAFPGSSNIAETTYNYKTIHLSPYLLLAPMWFITGVLSMTWLAYLLALLASNMEDPLAIANAITMPLALIFFAITFYNKILKNKEIKYSLLCEDKKTRVREWIVLGFVTLLAFILMWTTFYVKGGQLHIGVSVFSDFSPHIGMIRSFSYGDNFPTSYSHFAGEDIKYHFMFQFLVGNLEFLGMRIDYAFNIPSILSLISAFMLLYVLALKITGRVLVGILALLFFAFRSGKALLLFLSRIQKDESVLKTLWNNTNFIGDTPHEDWGLWNLNVYCNQRHLALGLAVMFFVLIMFLPNLYEMFEVLKSRRDSMRLSGSKRLGFKVDVILASLRCILFSREGWEIKNIPYPVSLGILLGSLSFFNGSAVIGCLLVLFVIAVLSKRRLEFLITAVIAVILSMLQSGLFIEGVAVSPELLFGFIAENKTIFGVVAYLEQLLGILPLCIALAFIFGKCEERYLILAVLAPLVFAFTVSLTVDVTVNHKYIMMSCILVGIFVASLITKILDRRKALFGIAGVLLILMLTLTGIYDFTTVLRKNLMEDKIVLNMEDPLTNFIRDNSDSQDIFLTDAYSINQVVFGGAMLYQGHQYYAWSAGYDTPYRDKMVSKMYEVNSSTELNDLVKENNIRYIIIDYGNRISGEYILNEDNIRATYECVYETGTSTWDISIFDTRKILKQ